jgi:hypothetical protein
MTNYTVFYQHRPASWERLGALVQEIQQDELHLDSLPQSEYWRYDGMLDKLVDKLDRAQSMLDELDSRENGHL